MVNLLLKLFVKDYRNTKDATVRKNYGLLGSFFGLFTNLILFVAKIVIGVMLGVFSVITDSINNLSDFGNNLLSIVGVRLSAKPADKDHPYGHQRIEYILSLFISLVVMGLAVIMIYQGVLNLIEFCHSFSSIGTAPVKELTYVMYVVTLIVLSLAIAFKLLQSYVYFSLGNRIDSLPLKALGKDSRNDVLATFATVIGIVVAWFTHYDIDCFFTIAVAIFVLYSGFGIMKDSVLILIGQTPSKELVESLIALIEKHEDALEMHDLSLHYYGKVIYGVIHIEVDANRDIMESHELCDTIEKEAKEQLQIYLTVHMDPVRIHDPETERFKIAVEQALQEYHQEGITMHDFRILSLEDKKKVEFDLVIPADLEDSLHEQKLHDFILEHLQKECPQPIELVIEFDNRVTDFLDGTEAEKNNG